MLRQLEFALFDFRLHREYDQQGGWYNRSWMMAAAKHPVLVPPAFNRFQHSFSHILAGVKWQVITVINGQKCYQLMRSRVLKRKGF